MRQYEAHGPDGKRFTLHADSEEALKAALTELFPEPLPPPPDHAAEAVDLMRQLVAKKPPPAPEIPAPEKVDLAPVIAALRALERKDPEPVDLKPLADKVEALGGLFIRLASAVSKANAAAEERHGTVLEAIDRLQRIMGAPRKLVRENGRPVASVVDFDGEYAGAGG